MAALGRRRRRAPSRRQPARAPDLPTLGAIIDVALDGDDLARSTTVEAVDGHRLLLAPGAERHARAARAPAGGRVRLRWSTPLGLVHAGGALLEAIAPRSPGDPEGDHADLWSVVVERTTRSQRRSAVRVRYVLDAVLRRDASGATSQATIVDLSEGGVACVVPADRAPDVGERVDVRFALPGAEPIAAPATVARAAVTRPQRGDLDGVRLGLDFVDEDPARREQLRRFAFDQQLRRR